MNREELRIVVLDDVSISDEQRARLDMLGDLRMFEHKPASRSEVIGRLAEAEIALVSEVALDGEILREVDRLQMLSLWSSGYDHIDVETANALGITVCHAPGCSANAIAEHTIASAIYFIHQLKEANQHVQSGSYAWEAFVTPELRGQTFGIIGLGRIGVRVAEIAQVFDCRVIAHTRHPSPERASRHSLTFVDLDTLLRESDIISINCALLAETTGLIGFDEFATMERNPILINTARGRIVDQNALWEALHAGQICGAALDVLWNEPPNPADPLLQMENVLFTPHSAGSSIQTFECLSETCVGNVEAFLTGHPQNIVWSNKHGL